MRLLSIISSWDPRQAHARLQVALETRLNPQVPENTCLALELHSSGGQLFRYDYIKLSLLIDVDKLQKYELRLVKLKSLLSDSSQIDT